MMLLVLFWCFYLFSSHNRVSEAVEVLLVDMVNQELRELLDPKVQLDLMEMLEHK